MAASRLVKELLELGVVDLGEAPDELAAPVVAVAEVDSAPAWSNDAAFDDTPSFAETRTFVATPTRRPSSPSSTTRPPWTAPSTAPARWPACGADGDAFDPNALVIEEPTYGSPAAEPEHLEPAVVAGADDEPTDAAEIARQLANLSPKAAKAVAAAGQGHHARRARSRPRRGRRRRRADQPRPAPEVPRLGQRLTSSVDGFPAPPRRSRPVPLAPAMPGPVTPRHYRLGS